MTTVAKNSAKDARRKRLVAEAKKPLLVEQDVIEATALDALNDDFLALMFACCHPRLSLDSQVALILRWVAGFSTEEIARAFITSEDTISQRLLRAKQMLSKSEPTDQPQRADPCIEQTPGLAVRLKSRASLLGVLGAVYAMFNEGYTTSRGGLMRLDLQAEALTLTRQLSELAPSEPEVFGALAIMAFAAARAASRETSRGQPVMLSSQDRSRWSQDLTREGLMALTRARSLGGKGFYVLQAEITAVHMTAPSWDATHWESIVALYDKLLELSPTPVVELNRAIALAMLDGPKSGLLALERLETALSSYHLFFATRADFLEKLGQDATADLRRAIELTHNEAEKALLRERLSRLSSI